MFPVENQDITTFYFKCFFMLHNIKVLLKQALIRINLTVCHPTSV